MMTRSAAALALFGLAACAQISWSIAECGTWTEASYRAFPAASVQQVTDHGAVGDGVEDDTDAIQAAIDAAVAQGNEIVYFPPGTYKVSIRATPPAGLAPSPYKHALRVGSDVTLLGPESGPPATVRLEDEQGDFHAVLMSLDATGRWTLADDLWIENLTFDGNRGGQTSRPADSLNLKGTARAAIWVRGTNVGVVGSDFVNHDNANTVAISGISSNVCVIGNRFSGVGGGEVHDHSSVYVDAQTAFIGHNTFDAGGGIGIPGAVTAIETHGDGFHVSENSITNYLIGMNVTKISVRNATQVSGHRVDNNTIVGAARGVQLWSYRYPEQPGSALRVSIDENRIGLDPTGWRTATPPWEHWIAGIYLVRDEVTNEEYTLLFDNLAASITHNTISFPRRGAVPSYDARLFTSSSEWLSPGIWLMHDDATLERLTVIGNEIENPLSAGIYVFMRSTDVEISDNLILNPGTSWAPGLPERVRAGISLHGEDWNAASITSNCFRDDQPTATMLFGLALGDDFACASCVGGSNAIEVVDPEARVVDEHAGWNYQPSGDTCLGR